MLDFQIPRITSESVEENRGTFTIEPLDRGFGYTFGNSLRRVLLSSIDMWDADQLGYTDPASWQLTADTLVSMGLLDAAPDLSGAYTNDFLPGVP